MPSPSDQFLFSIVQKDNSLYSLGWYLSWTPGNKEAILDGKFTAEDLRMIANHMDYVNNQRKP